MNKEIIIETELINKEVEEALNGDIKDLWKVFKTLRGNIEFNKSYDLVRYGVDIRFDIRLTIYDFVELKPEHGVAQIARKQMVDITDYWNELDEREEIMRDCIRSKYDNSFDKQIEGDVKGFT